jgi:toxin HigB-1
MILSFRDKRTRQFAEGKRVKAFSGFEMQAHKRLLLLHLARHLQALRALPGNRLEAFSGDRAGQYSIRINEQWRICFEWRADTPGPSNVEIVDYHLRTAETELGDVLKAIPHRPERPPDPRTGSL